MDSVGRKIPTNIIQIKFIKLRGFAGSESFFILSDNISVDFLFVDFTCQHSDNEFVHGSVFIAFFKTL